MTADIDYLAVLPLLVWALGHMAGLPPQELAVAVTLAAMPTGATAFILARRYATGMDRSGATVLLGTVMAV